MSDFITRLSEEDTPVEREVTIGAETGSVWFRRVSGGEREKLLEGYKLNAIPGESGSVEIDLSENERQKHLLVQFSVCGPDGRRVFKTLRDVQKIPNYKLKALLKIASEINADLDDEDLGKD